MVSASDKKALDTERPGDLRVVQLVSDQDRSATFDQEPHVECLMPSNYTHLMLLPKISVITPSYNQGQFIEQTILSVISQQYPNLEYILMDGGSDDETVEIIRKYGEYFTHWQSQKDNGQASAINAGFKMATGDILCWINSDDMYMPGVFTRIAAQFRQTENPTIIFGNCLHFNDKTEKTRGSNVARAHSKYTLSLCDYIIQPSSFWNKQAWELTGQLNESLTYAFDWDWFIRASRAGTAFLPVQEYLSLYRIHEAHKSGKGAAKRVEELQKIVSLYNEEKLSRAFAKWMRIYTKNNFKARLIDNANRFELSFINALVRLLFFSSLSPGEYRGIIAMK